jgi:GNAT superfamily N-acetyltransferase
MTAAGRAGGVIRPIAEGDFDRWLPLWHGYLRFYRAELADDVTRATFGRLCEADEVFGFVVESEGELVGLVHALLHPTTWSRAPSCYLEDLFVAQAARGSGAARALVEEVAAEGARRGAAKVYWLTQEFNGPARSLYDRIATRSSFVVYERDLPGSTG